MTIDPRAQEEFPMKAKAHATDERPTSIGPTDDQIAQRAYELFLVRGATHGQDVDDWLRAERELQAAEGREH